MKVKYSEADESRRSVQFIFVYYYSDLHTSSPSLDTLPPDRPFRSCKA